MKRVMPSTAASIARLETILSLRQRLALLHQLERKLREQCALLEVCRAEAIGTWIGRPCELGRRRGLSTSLTRVSAGPPH